MILVVCVCLRKLRGGGGGCGNCAFSLSLSLSLSFSLSPSLLDGLVLGKEAEDVKDSVLRLNHTAVGDDSSGDELGRRDVERRVPHIECLPLRHDPGARVRVVRDLLRVAQLDRDLRAAVQAGVDRRHRRRHVERDAVVLRGHRHVVRADLVRGRTVGAHTVGADDAGGDLLLAHEVGDGGVDDERRVHALRHALVRGQTAALVVRPRLKREDALQLVLLVEEAHNAQGRAVAGGGQGAGVADGDDLEAVARGVRRRGRGARARDVRGAVLRDARVVALVVRQHLLGSHQVRLADGGASGAVAGELGGDDGLQVANGVVQVDGGGAAGGEVVKALREERGEGRLVVAEGRRLRVRLDGQAEGGGDGDGGGAADAHVADGVPGVLGGGDGVEVRGERELLLVQELHRAAGVLDRTELGHCVCVCVCV
eukprot:Rhum_TRINITY_DN15235_c15_g5::Rhum_TRINITY_DN15235_c15_g5_i1::g.146248::m.146248